MLDDIEESFWFDPYSGSWSLDPSELLWLEPREEQSLDITDGWLATYLFISRLPEEDREKSSDEKM